MKNLQEDYNVPKQRCTHICSFATDKNVVFVRINRIATKNGVQLNKKLYNLHNSRQILILRTC